MLAVDAPPVTEPVELEGEDAWEQWQQAVESTDSMFAGTLPSDAHAQAGAAPQDDIPLDGPVTLESVLAWTRRANRVCPQQEPWAQLHRILAAAGRGSPPPPVSRAGWELGSSTALRGRLRDQLQWAADHGCLAQAWGLLKELPESGWRHLGE